MFTGIVKGLGTIVAIEERDNFRVVTIDVNELVPEARIGGSVAIDGACLTIVKIDSSSLWFEVMQESLAKTTLSGVKVGDRVNIETPLRMGDELGGHIVQGHVDSTAKIVEKVQDGHNTRMRFEAPIELAKYLVDKGSVTLDGVSLTVCRPSTINYLPPTLFDVYLLPLTLDRTTLGLKDVGERVNLEVDYLLKRRP